MSAITVTGLQKSFGGTPVLRGVELAIEPGSFTAILGASGSGKTTLLRLLVGFERADAGSIAIDGRVVESDAVHLRPERRKVGYVPQEGTLFPHLTVAENVGFGLPRAARAVKAAELLELVGLASHADRYPHQLSGGQQQRVALARALAIEPAVVLLDEPFASLDTRLRAQTRDDVAAILRRTGATAVLVTHDQSEALSFADAVAVIRDGIVAQLATPAELYTTPLDDDLAHFTGEANIVEATRDEAVLRTPLGALPAPEDSPSGGAVRVLIRPEQLALRVAGTTEATARVVRIAYLGHEMVVELETVAPAAGTQLRARVPAVQRDLAAGDEVGLEVLGPVHVWAAA